MSETYAQPVKSPDKMGTLRRSHYCGSLRPADQGKTVTVCGWVQRQRDLGGLIFVDLRDRSGILQLAFDDGTDEALFEKAAAVRSEYVLMAQGKIRPRASVNPDLPTGEIELEVTDLRVLSAATTPPFEILDNSSVKEELRLKYRYLDLRRPKMQRSMILRHQIVKAARDYFDENGFLEIETPVLIKSTPEGARDYLVPSRVHPGEFYALPQSPQQYKQLLMLSGFDRYMQIARCFRDEDLRADRQPEFTQIDLEMSFVDADDVMEVCEGFAKYVFKKVLNLEFAEQFPRLSYTEAMTRFGSDKPDLRFGMEFVWLTELLKTCEFKVFSGAAGTGGIAGLNAKGAAEVLTRKEIDKLTDRVKTYGAKGLAFTRLTADGVSSSFEKFLTEEERMAIREKMGAEPGDVLLLVADADLQVVYDALGALRCELGRRLGLIGKDDFKFLWVTDFPLFEYDAEEGRYVAKHHPFTSPKDEDVEKLTSNPAECRAKAYDLVLNGTEIGGGSVRINNPALQAQMFAALGFSEEETRRRFGFLIEAFRYGAPPHAGMAFGLDRLVMLMLGLDSIRDVIAFPKTAAASELMTDAPSPVDEQQLAELCIALRAPANEDSSDKEV